MGGRAYLVIGADFDAEVEVDEGLFEIVVYGSSASLLLFLRH